MTTKQNKKRRTNTKKKQPQTEVTKELIIWITLILSILLLLCVFQLCGPLNNVFGAFLFGCFGFLAYLFPFVLFFTVGFYYMNKENKRVVHRIFGCWVLYLLICGIIHMFYTSSIKTVWDSYTFGLKTHGGGGFFGGCISMGLTAIMGTLATFLMLFIFAIMLLVFITGKFSATIFVEESAEKYQEISEEKRIHREAVQKERKEQQKNKRTTYTFPKEKTVKNVERPTPVLDENKVEDSLEVKNNLETETTTNEMKIHRGIEEVPIYEKEIEEKFGKNVERSDHSLYKHIERAM